MKIKSLPIEDVLFAVLRSKGTWSLVADKDLSEVANALFNVILSDETVFEVMTSVVFGVMAVIGVPDAVVLESIKEAKENVESIRSKVRMIKVKPNKTVS
jgi:hypothetical protein